MTSLEQLSPAQLARACGEAMWTGDSASRRLGMTLEEISPGSARLTFVITPEMVNAHGTSHGGLIFALADSAFAFASNSYNNCAVAQHCTITFVNPAMPGDRLFAQAREISRRGSNGIYDVDVTNQNGVQIALFRGHSRLLRDRRVLVQD